MTPTKPNLPAALPRRPRQVDLSVQPVAVTYHLHKASLSGMRGEMYPPYDVTRIPGQKALARFPRAKEVALQQGIPNVKALDQYRKAYCEVQYAKALAKSKGVEVKSQSQEGGSAVAEEQTNRTRPVKVEGKEKQKRVD